MKSFCLPASGFVAGLIFLMASNIMGVSEGRPSRLDESPQPRGYVCHRLKQPLQIDGRLDDAAWHVLPWTEDFVDIEGSQRPRPRFRTRAKLAWDDDALYIGAELEEPHVRAVLTKHDSYIFHEDHNFEVFLDPDADSHLYAELEINARNTTWDLLLTKPYKDGGQAIDAWEIDGVETAVHVDGTINDPRDRDRGWSVEIRWPWRGLRQIANCPVPPRAGDLWRINFSRVELTFNVTGGEYHRVRQPEENWVWSPQDVIDMHRPERWGYLQFSAAAPGSDPLRLDPTAPARHLLHRVYEAQNTFYRQHRRYARSLGELKVGDVSHGSFAGPPQLEAISRWYEIYVDLRDGRRIRLQADAKITVEDAASAK